MPPCLVRWIGDLGFLPIVYDTKLDTVLTCVALSRRQEADWSCVDLKYPFFFDRENTSQVISLEDRCVHEQKHEVNRQLEYQELLLPFSAARLKSYICESSHEDAVALTREPFVEYRLHPYFGCVVVGSSVALDEDC